MTLEKIAATYGFVDYWDHNTGHIYHLSVLQPEGSLDKENPVVPVSHDGEFIGGCHFDVNFYKQNLAEM
jgi:hypothetical protein